MRPGDVWDKTEFVSSLLARTDTWKWKTAGGYRSGMRSGMASAVRRLAVTLDNQPGWSVQDRWGSFETKVWPRWHAGEGRSGEDAWRWGTWAAVLTRTVQPSWEFIESGRVGQWTVRLPDDDPFAVASQRLLEMIATVGWGGERAHRDAWWLGLRVLLMAGIERVEEVNDDAFKAAGASKGATVLDAAFVQAGMFDRGPQHGSTRRNRVAQRNATELVEMAGVPERFRAVTIGYLDEYRARVGAVYSSVQGKSIALGHWWAFIDAQHPEVRSCIDVRPLHTREFLEYAKERARVKRRRLANDDGLDDRGTAYVWIGAVRLFFADLAAWGMDEGSPLAGHAPPGNPFGARAQSAIEIGKIKQRRGAAMAATVIELERELPKVRAFAFTEWDRHRHSPRAKARLQDEPEWKAFWAWALLELLVQSGLRIEEALELTTLDVLRRELSDGRRYYLLHVKPSKYDRARVVPIGDGLGRVIAEIVGHVQIFYGTAEIPSQRMWCSYEKHWRPAAPYLFQGVTGHPSVVDHNTVRNRLAGLAEGAGITRADGTALTLRPHDCRRMFASEHLNNATPVHVIQALLGHASIETVMIYAKLYPTTLVEEYRKTLRSIYQAHAGDDAFAAPTLADWAALDEACVMRDMGTHLCALPVGQHCPKGLVCLGCGHAQPKRSAAPVFVRMISSHERALDRGRSHGEPAGQLAARELEIGRIRSALRRAEQLSDDVAAAMESELITPSMTRLPV